MLELGRADIGFGRLVLDDVGVTRTKLRTRRIAWTDVREYRLKLQFVARSHASLFRHDFVSDIVDLVSALRGNDKRIWRYGMELLGAPATVAFNWRYQRIEEAIALALHYLSPPITAAARAELATTGTARFGPIALAKHGIVVDDHPPLAAAAVEAIELFDVSPVQLRVARRGKIWPYAKVNLHHVPNPLTLVELATELGYKVTGRELLPSPANPA